MTDAKLALLLSALGAILAAISLGPTAALFIATFLIGALITELAHRRP
jgi:hypothetical protein